MARVITEGRQTAFPGIVLESLEVRSQHDEEGAIKNFVDRGLTAEFETIRNANQFTEDTIGDIIQNLESNIGPLGDDFRIIYTMLVRAKPVLTENDFLNTINTGTSERSVSMRSRGFVRTKNPFEPDIIEVGQPTKDEQMSEDIVGTVYQIDVMITK